MINYALTRGAKIGNGNNQEKLSKSKRLKYLVCFELQGKPFSLESECWPSLLRFTGQHRKKHMHFHQSHFKGTKF